MPAAWFSPAPLAAACPLGAPLQALARSPGFEGGRTDPKMDGCGRLSYSYAFFPSSLNNPSFHPLRTILLSRFDHSVQVINKIQALKLKALLWIFKNRVIF